MRTPHHSPRFRQQGIIAVMAVILLIAAVIFALGQTYNITGNNNAVTEYQINNGNKLLFVAVNGNSNTVNTTQQGTGNHYLDISLTGDSNSVNATQTGSQSHKATINLTNAGGPASVTLNQNSNTTGQVYSIIQSCTTPAGCSATVTQP